MPTCARHLGVDPETANAMGGWAGRYPMHVRYDSVACAAELLPKMFVIKNVMAGWRPAVRGALPATAPYPWTGIGREMAVANPQQLTVQTSEPMEPSVAEALVCEKRAALARAGTGPLLGKAVCC